jgi:hypothetical protein
MPTSGETSWSLTAGDLIKCSLVELGVVSMGEEPELSEYNEATNRLNGLLKYLATKGAMYRDATTTVTVVGGTGLVVLPVTVRDVSSVRHVVSATYQRTMALWNRSQYYALPNRATVGSNPSVAFVNKTISGLELRIWPVPAANVTLHIDYSRAVEIVTAPDETLDIPEEWQDAIQLALASRCASMFGADRIDPAKVQRIDAQANAMLTGLMDADRPDSYFFEPYNGYC